MSMTKMSITKIVLSLVVVLAIAGAVAAVPLGGGSENDSVLDRDYDDSWVADFPETIGGFNVGVGHQHKWDRLGPEKIIIMKSCV